MKKSLTILSLVLLGFSHAGFAQAPKEVIVLDGQVAINNGPLNPASVMVENGVLNPLPIFDVTPPAGEEFWGTLQSPSIVADRHVINIPDIPPGKLLRVKALSIFFRGHANIAPRCSLSLQDAFGRRFSYQIGLMVNAFPIVDLSEARAGEQWSDLPAAPSAEVTCFLTREDVTPNLKSSSIVLSYFGYLHDAPAP